MRKAYEEYKATGIQWLPKIPRHWDYKKINSLFLERKTKVSDKDYQPLSVTKSGILHQLTDAAKSSDSDNRKLVMAGDFVINSRSDRKGSCGVSALDGSVSLINIVLEPKRKLEQLFVHYLLRCQPFSEEYYRYGRGIVADLWTTRYSEMKSIFLPVPPREEQEQIVRFLDWKVSSINKLINIKQQEISELKELKKATISDAVTHGLDKTVPMKDSGITWLGNIPQHWNIKRLKYISLKHFSGTWGNECDGSSNDKNCIRVADFNFENLSLSISNPTKRNYTCDEIRKYALQDGDILVEKSGGGTKTPVGRTIYYDLNGSFLYANFIEMIRVKQQNSKFLVYLLAAMYHSGYINTMYNQTTGIQNLDISKYMNQLIVLPPRNEQDHIVRFLDARCVEIDRLIAAKQAQINNLHNLKSSLIADVVTGQIDVRDVTIPNYETVQEHADEAPDTEGNPLEEAEEV